MDLTEELQRVLPLVPAEVLVTMKHMLPEEQNALVRFWQKILHDPELGQDQTQRVRRLISAINRAEVPLTPGITSLGAELTLLTGQLPVFFALTDPESNANNPEVFNLRALHSLLFKGDAEEALGWLDKVREMGDNGSGLSVVAQNLLPRAELMSQCLAYLAYSILGDEDEATFASEEAGHLLAKNKYKDEDKYFWLWVFKALSELDKQAWDNALQFSEDAYQIAQKLRLTTHQGMALQLKGRALQGKQNHIPAYHAFLSAKKLLQETGSVFLVTLYSDLAALERVVGRYGNARSYYQRTIVEAQGMGEKYAPRFQLPGLKGLADLYLIQGSYQLALESYERARRLAQDTRAHAVEAACLTAIGCIHTDQRNYTKARQSLVQSLTLREEYELNKAYSLLELGYVGLREDNVGLAETQLQLLRTQTQTPHLGTEIILFQAEVLTHQKLFDEARSILERQLFLGLKEFDLRTRVPLALCRLAVKEAIEEDDNIYLEEAAERLEGIRSLATKPSFPSLQVLFLLLDAVWVFLDGKDRSESLDKIMKASKIAQKTRLLHITQRIEFYHRRFSRSRVRVNQQHLIELLEDIQRNILYLTRRILQ